METSLVEQKVQHVISQVTSGIGNIHCMAPYDRSLSDCINTIIQDHNKFSCFTDTFGFSPDVVKQLLPYIPGLRLTDIVIGRYVDDLDDPSERMIFIDS